jgi:hypothetical protein
LKCINNWVISDDKNWDFLLVTISPILKSSSKPPSAIKSYRPIALSSSIAWILEKMIFIYAEPYFTTLPEQYGYKAGHSTTHCISIIKQMNDLDDVNLAFFRCAFRI